ncbi:YpoC family protein [Bacillus sp. S/N-304-OC-R1]|uniref:YpoC family protein n=1 Tax=Bacillus sp. S/N-304-OC-R1 TaxID=2758034 RepID=UPI001C8F165C|nr:hypothetical protein [Bacillus sp. S/N-304-OC-R1]MBY0122624.1 hypothetical protein [Bacillus sp. S/N-304-OC-R1]
MKNNMELIIPQQLHHAFFFSDNEKMMTDTEALKELNTSTPFLYEAAFYSGIQALKPWDIQEQSIPALIKEWQNVKAKLDLLFAKREVTQAVPLMKKGISLFLEFIYWANGLPVILKNGSEINQLAIKPVNITDRLDFIIHRPSLFHSFIVLAELMTEMNKHYEKALVLKKASKH